LLLWIFIVVFICAIVVMAAPAKPAPGDIVPFQKVFVQAAAGRWVDRAAQAQAESGFDPLAKSPVGAKGILQAMDATWKDYQKNGWVPQSASPFDVIPAITGAHKYMNQLEAMAHGFDPALASYNWGIGHVLQVQRRVAAIGEPGATAWVRLCPKETQNYLIHNRQNRNRIHASGGKP
jgi:soluble lytic murein transglycosylase-like protein